MFAPVRISFLRTLANGISSGRFPALFLALLAMLPAVPGRAQFRFPAATAVGASAAPLPVAVSIARAGTLDSIRVTTQGAVGFDFSDAGGGTCTQGTALAVGAVCSVQVAFAPKAPGERDGAVVLADHAGQTLGIAFVSGQSTGPVATFVPGTINTVAGNQAWIYSGDGGPATQSSIFLPFGLAVDAAGNLYLADSSNNRIRKVDATTGTIATIAGTGIIGSTGDGGPATAAALSNPTSVALDAAGNLYFADSGNNTVRKIDALTGTIATIAGIAGHHGYAGDGGPATAALLTTPNGVAIDSGGNLYVTDTGNHAVRRVAAGTGSISTVAGVGGQAGFAGDGGPATAALLSSPWSVTPAPTGELYIADQNNNRIRVVSAAGVIETLMGNGAAGYTGDDGPVGAAQLNVPAAVAIDVAGNLYIADSGNNRVRKVNAKTAVVTSVAGNLGESFSGDDGPADQAGLYGPYALALDGQGSLYVADVFHNRIRKVSANAATLNFPPMRVGRVAAPLTQKLENDGNAPLTVSGETVISDAQVDAGTTTCDPAAALDPLAMCVVGAAFAPTHTGQRVKGGVGVGSNAANAPGVITLAGQVLDIDPATVLLSSSPNPSVTGSAVTFTVVATSAGATPTGMVTLFDGTAQVAQAALNAGGVNFQVSTLTGGQHTMTAVYAGDSSTAGGTSSPLLQIVKDAQAPTTTTVSSSANPVDAGAMLHLTATVTIATAGAGNGAIAGTVSFREGATVLGSAQIAGGNASTGTATLNLSSLAVGTHAVVASYAGSSTYAPSTSAAYTQQVKIASSQVTLATDRNPSHSGAIVTVTGTVTTTGGTATGKVIFFDGNVALGTASLNAQGRAVLATPSGWATVGTHTLTAAYLGDAANTGSTSDRLQQVIDLATTATTLASDTNPAGYGAQVTLTATVTGNGGTPAGQVQFLDGQVVIGTAVLANGVAALPLATLGVAHHSITAVYGGDALDQGSRSAELVQVVDSATATVTVSPSNDPAIVGTNVVFTMQVNGTGARPTGTVSLLDGTTLLGQAAIDGTGAAAISIGSLALGQHPISAVYSGDTYHTATTSATVVETVQQYTTTMLTASANHSIAGTSVTIVAVVAGGSGRPTPGTVTLMDAGKPIATLTLDANGQASLSTAGLAVGQHNLTATYPGETLSAASTSVPLLLTVMIATTGTTLVSSQNPAFAGALVTLTAQVSGNGGIPGGLLTFRDGNAVLGSGPLSATGTATLTTSTLAAGVHGLTAGYAGDANDQPSVSAALSERIVRQTTVTLTSSANPALLTDNVMLTIAVTNGAAGTAATGMVTIMDGTAVLTTVTLDAQGNASYLWMVPALGSHTLLASYAGDAENNPAGSATLKQVVTLRPTTTSLTVSATALSAGQQLILISVLRGAGPLPPTGTIQFASGGTVLGSATVDAGGVATLTATPSQATMTVVASYSGDSLYAQSNSPSVGVVVGPPVEFNLTLTPAVVSVVSGQHTTLQIEVASAPTFADTLQFGCAGLPDAATCTFSSDTMAVAGGIAQKLTVTIDTGNPLGAGAQAKLETFPGTACAALLPLGMLLAFGLRRRRLGLRLLAVLLALGASAGLMTGCGSSFSQRATAPGTYDFQVMASGAKTIASQGAAVHLTVTK